MMRTLVINDTDITTLGATLLSIDYGYSEVITYKDWLKGSMNPIFYSQDVRYTTAAYKILVEASNRKELDLASSNLVALARKGKYQATDADFFIDGNFVSAEDTPINDKAKEIIITVEGIKSQHESRIFAPAVGEVITFTPLGNCEVPARFMITMSQGYPNYFLTVNGKDYKIKNTSTKSSITVDGILGGVIYGGGNKIEDYVEWEFPTLIGGKENTIEITGGTLTITYDGRWM